ncbi:MAG: CcmD family protein [Chloroflexi bacterium]|jgi:CcmD family protein|nr:CcmD family protein [Chloroflexota bacterium]MBT7080630.1 CcmD family protein [Chloroflexota bacterium]MBT7289981.1 CcmD family protein [Chloroflexota bacterium]
MNSETYFWAAFIVLWVVIIGYSIFLVQRNSQLKRTLAQMKEHLKESQKR